MSASPLTELVDDMVRSILASLPHKAGKARFALTGRRARTVHATTMPDTFKVWLTELSTRQQRWVAGLCVAPPIPPASSRAWSAASGHVT